MIRCVGDVERERRDRSTGLLAFVKVLTRPKGTSSEIEVRNGHLWTIHDGKILSLKTFPEREKAFEAAGLSE